MATPTRYREAARVTEPRRASRRVLTWIVVVVVALVAAVAVYWALARSGDRARPATGHRRRGPVPRPPRSRRRRPAPTSVTPTGGGAGADGERVPRRAGPVPGRPRRRSRARPRIRSGPRSSR